MSSCGRCGGIRHINLNHINLNFINLKVTGQDGGEVWFRIKSSSTLRQLMNAYSDRQSVDPSSIAFIFDGRLLGAEQTPDELDMEDGDEIYAILYQSGKWHLLDCIPYAHLFMIMLVLCTS